ncbi:MAG: flippase-like domain-containing protein [Myxococcota bacterium]|nr:flippase-like domain-containing protein [Myxococcota bacterium]
MKRFVSFMLVAGLALLVVVVSQTDLQEAWARLEQLGWTGAISVLAIYVAGFVLLTASWLVTLPSARVTPRWLYRLWKILMVGSALDTVTPLAGLGGEPVKAALLKRQYGVDYREGATSLVLIRMTDLVAQIVFISIGFVLMFDEEKLAPGYRWVAAGGLVAFALAILLFFLVQRRRAFSWLRERVRGGWIERRLGARGARVLDALRDVEDRLVGFYAGERLRFVASASFAFMDWVLSALATLVAIRLLGVPISLGDAMIIESFVVLVRSAFFFVPGDLGTQDAAQVLICGAVTGSPPVGLALAALRRVRDILFIGWGLAIGSHYSLGTRALLEAAALEEQARVTEGPG